ncbi:uncharacterized protein [Hoplias malabaricus]
MKIISVCGVPHLCLFALRDIQPGEEISYDYGGYDLPWRRGTWLCMKNPFQFENEKEVACEEQQPEYPENSTETKFDLVPTNNTDEEMISSNTVPCDSQPKKQVKEDQLEYEEQTFNSHSAEQEDLEEQKTFMEDKPSVEEQSHTESTEQMSCEKQQPAHKEDSTKPAQFELFATNENIEQQTLMEVEPCVDEHMFYSESTDQPSYEDDKRQSEDQPPQVQADQQSVCAEEKEIFSDEAPQTQTAEEKMCEDDFLQIQLFEQLSVIEKMICEKAAMYEMSNTDEEMISTNTEPCDSQPKNEAEEDQMEYAEQISNSHSERQEDFKEQQTLMQVKPSVEEQSHSESAEQACENDQLKSNLDTSPIDEQITEKLEQVIGEIEPSHLITETACTEKQDEKALSQTSEQMVCEEEQQMCDKDSSRRTKQILSFQDDQDSNPSDVESCGNDVSSDEEFIPPSDCDSDSDDDSEEEKQVEENTTQPNNNHFVTEATKKNFCFVCGKACHKIARHLKVHRKENFEIDSAFKLKKSSKERRHILKVLRYRGNYQHNNRVLSKGSGLIKVVKTPKGKIDTQDFEYCMYCKGLYMRKELGKHSLHCLSNPDRNVTKKVLGLAAIAQSPHLQDISEDVKKVLCGMNQDEVTRVVRNDEYVVRLAQAFFNKNSTSKERHAFVRQTLRCIGKFLIALHKKSSLRNLAEAIKPSSFPQVIEAVKEVAEFNEETKRFASPSLARTIALTLRKYCIMTAEKAEKVGDRRLIESTAVFMKLFGEVRSQFGLGEKYRMPLILSNPPLLPFVRDVTVLYCYLEKASQCAMKELKETPTPQSYADLSKVTLAQIMMFNRRHGEVSQLTINNFLRREKAQVLDDALTEFEKEFCKDYCKIEVKQRMEGYVTIFLTPALVNALMLLIEKREQCGVCDSNIYVFGQHKGRKHYRGENALRICARESHAVNPDQLTSTEFSRHIATLTQVLSLQNQQLAKLAKFIGHDISVRKEYYRQPEATERLAKICELILAIEKGNVAVLLGESLDDILLPEQIYESGSEDDFEEECAQFEQHRAKLEEAAKKASINMKNSRSIRTRHTGASNNEVAQAENLQVEQVLVGKRKKVNRKPWTTAERAAIMKHFKKQIYYGNPASRSECRRCQLLEQPVLNNRSIQMMRDFVRNAGISIQRARFRVNRAESVFLCPQETNPASSTSGVQPRTLNTSVATALPHQSPIPSSSTVQLAQTEKPVESMPQLSVPPKLIGASILPLQTGRNTSSSVLPPPAANPVNSNVLHYQNINPPSSTSPHFQAEKTSQSSQTESLFRTSMPFPQAGNPTSSCVASPETSPLTTSNAQSPKGAITNSSSVPASQEVNTPQTNSLSSLSAMQSSGMVTRGATSTVMCPQTVNTNSSNQGSTKAATCPTVVIPQPETPISSCIGTTKAATSSAALISQTANTSCSGILTTQAVMSSTAPFPQTVNPSSSGIVTTNAATSSTAQTANSSSSSIPDPNMVMPDSSGVSLPQAENLTSITILPCQTAYLYYPVKLSMQQTLVHEPPKK